MERRIDIEEAKKFLTPEENHILNVLINKIETARAEEEERKHETYKSKLIEAIVAGQEGILVEDVGLSYIHFSDIMGVPTIK